jgi:hypothetical protein
LIIKFIVINNRNKKITNYPYTSCLNENNIVNSSFNISNNSTNVPKPLKLTSFTQDNNNPLQISSRISVPLYDAIFGYNYELNWFCVRKIVDDNINNMTINDIISNKTLILDRRNKQTQNGEKINVSGGLSIDMKKFHDFNGNNCNWKNRYNGKENAKGDFLIEVNVIYPAINKFNEEKKNQLKDLFK